jgi:hypothetical protein
MKTYEIRTTVSRYSSAARILNAELHVNVFLVGVDNNSSDASRCSGTINFEDRDRPAFPKVLGDNIEAEPDDDADEGANPNRDRTHASAEKLEDIASREIVARLTL